MKKKFSVELYGGPLDGAVMELPVSLEDGQRVSVDLVSREFTPEVSAVLTRPRGVAVHEMEDGVLRFVEQVDKEACDG